MGLATNHPLQYWVLRLFGRRSLPNRRANLMAVPKRKQSNSRTGKRRAHDFLKARELQACPRCGAAKPSHVVCGNCGHYMGRTVVEVE